MKPHSVFFPASLVATAQSTTAKDPWAADMKATIIAAVQPWLQFTDNELWELMFGHTITRSYMVWSGGFCPVCTQEVPMYSWEMDVFAYPWKVRCPHCKELFPKNDFYKFYLSGLDEHHIFNPKCADRSLLFNQEHPDPNDPLYTFGVDDGEGYVEGEKRWRFIGAYLIHGQWKKAIFAGIENLAAAYVVSGDRPYAHKAAVLLDRVADLYPTFDFEKEGMAYEKPHGPGYVNTWHDACVETRYMALAYDEIRGALQDDLELVVFLSQKAGQFGLANPKASADDIQRNIEERILRDAINNPNKIIANTPQTDITLAILKTVLGWPDNRDEVNTLLDKIVEVSTEVDGVTGEKGLAGYTAWAPSALAALLALYQRMDHTFLAEIFNRHPKLYQMYRFHIDTWCMQQYYPLVGDTGGFGQQVKRYVGVFFGGGVESSRSPGVSPSMYTFLWQLYKVTGDAAFVQAMYGSNGQSVEGLPFDLFTENPPVFQKAVLEIIGREGVAPRLDSVNKQQWHIAILRSGEGMNERALWVEYETAGPHGHNDGMHVGLFAKGLDLLPDNGYPPVTFGGHGTPEANWYRAAACHNTVAVDGPYHACGAYSHVGIGGKTTLWAIGQQVKVMRLSGAEIIKGQQFERTLAIIDISERDFYILDIFRVVGGKDHAKFMHSLYGEITLQGLTLQPAEEYGQATKMRNFCRDVNAQPGWSADWKVEDAYHYLPSGADIHLRYTDLTINAQAFTCEGWIYPSSTTSGGRAGGYEPAQEVVWIPRIMVRRQAEVEPLASTFVAIIEPYEGKSNITRIRRLSLETPEGTAYPEPDVAVEIQLADGRCDLLVAADVENPLGLIPSRSENKVMLQKEWGLRCDGEMCLVRRSPTGEVQRVAVCQGSSVSVEDVAINLKQNTTFIEARFEPRIG